MRPRWREGAFHARVAGGGALVRSPAGETWIDGRDAHALLRWLTPRMDGRTSVAGICAAVVPEQRPAVARVVEHLVAVGAAEDLDAPPAPEPPALTAVLPGCAPVLEGRGGLHDAVAGGGATAWSWRQPPSAGLVLSVHDVLDPERDRRLHRAFARRRVAWLPVRGGPGEVWIGPRSGAAPGCVECLRLRSLAARRDGSAVRRVARQAARRARGSPASCDPRVGALVRAAALAWAELEERTGRPTGLRLVLRLALAAAEWTAGWLAPVPDCPACGGPHRAGTGRELDGAALTAPAAAELPHDLAAMLVDARIGMIGRRWTRSGAGAWPATAEALAHVPEAAGRRRREEWGLGCGDASGEAGTIAVLEALERSCAAPRGRTVERASLVELGDRAIDPARLVLHSDDQYARPGFPYARLDPGDVQEWTWALSLAQRRHVAVPADLVFYRGRRRPPGRKPLACVSSSGCAIGSSAGQAALHAVLEVLERDALLLTWYGRRPPCRLDLDGAGDTRIARLAGELDDCGYDVAVFDTTPADIGVPCVWAMAVSRSDGGLRTLSGASCHPDPERAVLQALREVAGHLDRMSVHAASVGRRRALRLLAGGPALRRPRDHVVLYGLPEAQGRLRFLFEGERAGVAPRRHFQERGAVVAGEPAAWAPAVYASVLDAGLDVLLADMTASDVRALGLVAVRALIPGTLPMTFGGGLERTAGASRLAAPSGPLLPHPLG